MSKRVSIVFQEDKSGPGFSCFLDGITPERMAEIHAMPPSVRTTELSAAEFYAVKCFELLIGQLHHVGILRSAVSRKGAGEA